MFYVNFIPRINYANKTDNGSICQFYCNQFSSLKFQKLSPLTQFFTLMIFMSDQSSVVQRILRLRPKSTDNSKKVEYKNEI